jgi:molybdopterin synthase sulfur carrier subunit
MVTFNITGFLTEFSDGKHQILVESKSATVGEALDQLWKLHLGLRDRVLNEQGELRRHVNIFLNNENIRRQGMLATPLEGNSEITILPSVSGGSGLRR